jgi:hypothetical protein
MDRQMISGHEFGHEMPCTRASGVLAGRAGGGVTVKETAKLTASGWVTLDDLIERHQTLRPCARQHDGGKSPTVPRVGGEKHEMERRAERGAPWSAALVCLEHLHDPELRAELDGWIQYERCDFCERTGTEAQPIAVEMEVLVDEVMSAIGQDYERLADTGLPYDDPDMWPPTAATEELVEEYTYGVLDDDVIDALLQLVEPDEWAARDWGYLRLDHALRQGWDEFTAYVKHTARFVFLSTGPRTSLSPDEYTPAEMLDAVGKVVVDLGLVTVLPAGTAVFRGRMVDTDFVQTYTAATMGATPPDKANANRMSPAGISMFYGSLDRATALNEIAAHDGRAFGNTARFELVADLPVIDFTKQVLEPSIFNRERRRHRYSARFLQDFVADITKSITINDRTEHIEYVPTQVLTEYLRWLGPAGVRGLLLPSAQSDSGQNCVVFAGAEGCADRGTENHKTVLRYVAGSEQNHPRPT